MISSIKTGGVNFAVIYARPGLHIGESKAGLPVSRITRLLGLTTCEESRPKLGYMLLRGHNSIVNVTSFASQGITNPETLKHLIEKAGLQNVRYVLVRWPDLTLEAG